MLFLSAPAWGGLTPCQSLALFHTVQPLGLLGKSLARAASPPVCQVVTLPVTAPSMGKSFVSCTVRCPRLILGVLRPGHRVARFSKDPWFFLDERHQKLGSGYQACSPRLGCGGSLALLDDRAKVFVCSFADCRPAGSCGFISESVLPVDP